jgi:hypothetical protein
MDFFEQQIRELDQEIAHRLSLSSDAHDPDLPDATSRLPTNEATKEPAVPTGAAESNPPLSPSQQFPSHSVA